eukprot:TRINITY_DN7833_c0_g1_i1.p1 TRINITY_DN7833_c0_g1~~TRINITY_DN7833_c0_g1_i1.p1  ORF type:complete len:748 (+),score=133.23 TRINITY_DN7833_c0_g1_i1:160-2403(+)
MEDVCWDMDNLLPSNHIKEFNMKEFEHPVPLSDFRTLVGALHYNNYFTGFVADNYHFDRDSIKIIADMLHKNSKIEEVVLRNVGGTGQSFEQVGNAIAANTRSKVKSIDFSQNSIQDRGVVAFGKAIRKLQHGFFHINLQKCESGKKGMRALTSDLVSNPHMAKTLLHLDLSYNRLDMEGSSTLSQFLSNPNALQTLNIANAYANLDVLLSALMRGGKDLINLDISGNRITSKDLPALTKFLQSSAKLNEIHLSSCQLDVRPIRQIIMALVKNKNLANVKLDISNNKLGHLGANMIADLCPRIKNITRWDLSNTDLGDEGFSYLTEGFAHNTCLKELKMCDNFKWGKVFKQEAIDNLIELISVNSQCPLDTLDISVTPADTNPLKQDLLPFVAAIADNDSLTSLDLSGHQMADKGGISLGKSLQTNRTLKKLFWDRNGVKYQGYLGFKVGLERNTDLVVMPLPVQDISDLLHGEKKDIENVSSTILDIEAMIRRNNSPAKFDTTKTTSGGFSMLSAGESEEIHKLRHRIKATGAKLSAQQAQVLKDAEENDTNISSLGMLGEQIQQAMEDSVRNHMQEVVNKLLPMMETTLLELNSKIVANINDSYKSIGPEFGAALKGELDRYSKLDKAKTSEILVKGAASQVCSQLTQSMVSNITTASDMLFSKLFENLETIYGSISEETPAGFTPPAKPLPTVNKPAKQLPTPKIEKVESNISHDLVKSRPMGPKRRRPARRGAQRRPMKADAT